MPKGPTYDLKIQMDSKRVPEPLFRFLVDNAPHPDTGELISLACDHGFRVTITIERSDAPTSPPVT